MNKGVEKTNAESLLGKRAVVIAADQQPGSDRAGEDQ